MGEEEWIPINEFPAVAVKPAVYEQYPEHLSVLVRGTLLHLKCVAQNFEKSCITQITQIFFKELFFV